MKYQQAILSIVFSWLITLTLSGQSQTVRIYGSAPEYSDYALVFKHFQNFINRAQKELFTIKIDDHGTFDFSFPLEATTYAFSDIGQFRGFIYLSPGQEYHIKLPPFRPLSQAQQLNPFFQPEPVVIGILNEDSKSLNAYIRDFDQAFGDKLRQHAIKLITTKNQILSQNIIDSLETEFTSESTFFQAHKHFSYASLALLSSRHKERDVIKKYFSDRPVAFNMPAYWISFEEVFSGFCHPFFSEYKFQSPLSYRAIVDSLQTKEIFQRHDLAEVLALWIIYESYHEKLISKRMALELLDQSTEQTHLKPIGEIAQALYNRIKILMEGEKAPEFRLPDFAGNEKSLLDFTGKFVYLNFMHTDNFACRKDLKLLKKIHDTFNRDLEIVSIIIDEDFDKAASYLKENQDNMDWQFLYFAMQGNLINNYNVQAVPLYYLISPEGKLVMSPAPAPGENFHDAFVSEYKNYRRERLRKQPKNTNSPLGW
ncbi:TlpA family protein disulfide reductase [Thermophagus sp. OGC60D27]|uniref:TlpA family protein disulfide reductase n=1 Tax=Thermophagus sp. OGC60D27 TaxID=3458415 RepID=UPI0040379DD7